MHIDSALRSKLGAKSKKCFLVRLYGEGDFGFRLWDPEAKAVIKTRDVVFNEHKVFKDSLSTRNWIVCLIKIVYVISKKLDRTMIMWSSMMTSLRTKKTAIHSNHNRMNLNQL